MSARSKSIIHPIEEENKIEEKPKPRNQSKLIQDRSNKNVSPKSLKKVQIVETQ